MPYIPRRTPKKSKSRRLFTIILAGILIFAGIFLYKTLNNPTIDKSIDEKSTPSSSQTSAPAVNSPGNSSLTADLNKIIRGYPGVQVAVSVVDLDSGEIYDAGDTKRVFVAASITKILTAVGILSEVDNGQLSLSKTVDGSSIAYLLQTMIRDSNNQSWHSLRDYIGDLQLHSLAISTGLRGFTGGNINTLTAGDEAKLLSELALGRLISPESRDLLYSYMQNTSNDQLIPAALPSGATVYHKYGLLDGNLHDTAIINYKDHRFVLVILSNSPSGLNYDTRVQMIHKITETVVKDITQ